MLKENQRIMLSKRLLKETLLNLLSKKKIDQISVSELCALSELNRSTFYRHYQTPHDILMEMEMDLIREIHDMPLRQEDAESIRDYVRHICRFTYEHREKVKLFITNNTDSDLQRLFRKFSEKYLTERETASNGKTVHAATLQLLQTFYTFGCYAVLKQWLMEDLPLSADQVAEIILSPFGTEISLV